MKSWISGKKPSPIYYGRLYDVPQSDRIIRPYQVNTHPYTYRPSFRAWPACIIFLTHTETYISKYPALPFILFGLCLSYLAAFQLFKIPPNLPVLVQDYQYHRTLGGALMSVYALAGLILSFPIGRWISKSNTKHCILIGLGGMVIGNLVSMVQPETGWYMLAGRTVEGIAYAILAITGPVIAIRHAPASITPLVVGLIAVWIPMGQLAATLMTQYILMYSSWQGMWWICIACTITMIFWTAIMPDLDIRSPSENTPDDQVVPTILNREQIRLMWITALIFMLWAIQYNALMTWLPLYLIEHLDFSMGESLLGYVLPVVIVIIFNIITGVAIRSGIRPGHLLVSGLIIQAIVWWLIPLTGADLTGILSLGFFGMAAGMIATCLFSLPGVISGKTRTTASAFGIMMTGRNVGVFTGPLLLGQLYLLSGSWEDISPVFAVLTTLALFMGWILSRKLYIYEVRL